MILDNDYFQQVADHNQNWMEWAYDEIVRLTVKNETFTSDSLRESMLNSKRNYCNPNAIGAAFNAVASAGLITRVGFAKSTWPTTHNRIVSVLKSQQHER